MQSSGKGFSRLLFSAAGILIVLVLVVAVNVLSSAVNTRADLTEENLYTLSGGTRAIVKGLDLPVAVRFYFSRDLAQMPMFLKNYAARVRDVLREYEVKAPGKIKVQELNPTPDSDAEDAANLDGVYGQMLGDGEQLYLGLALSCLDETVTLPFLNPQDESLLEYQITRAIYRVSHPEKRVLGVLSSLPIMGTPPNMMMMQQGMDARGQDPWYIMSELKRDFDVRELTAEVETIDADIDILLLVHPKEPTDKLLYALDQFVLRGGRLIACLDPLSFIEMYSQRQSPMQPPGPNSSTLGRLLDTWGVQFAADKVVVDLKYQTEWQERGQRRRDPMIVGLGKEAFAGDDPSTSQLETALLAYAGAFTGQGAEGLTRTVLLSSSGDAHLIDGFEARMPVNQIVGKLEAEGSRRALAIRLAGTFKTAFPDGAPGTSPSQPAGDGDKPADGTDTPAADADTPADGTDKKPEGGKPAGDSLKSGKGMVVLIADTDFLHDAFCIERMQVFGQTIVRASSDNIALISNLVEQLSGDENLLSVRSRGVKSRPFVKVQDMKAAAETRYQKQIDGLETELNEAVNKLRELRQAKSPDQRSVLTPEQEETIAGIQRKKAQTAKDLKEVRKEFRRDIDALETRLKLVNIGLVPLLVAAGGVAVAILNRRRMAGK
ncbi:MAG: ABC-type uncharacterized transport system [Lentisphaerae bacterium ADurb.BinA184]|nr:MAG: ABC-type uncharacterized transport system [Lentisphaerae bacterium ADurb.BinA184]